MNEEKKLYTLRDSSRILKRSISTIRTMVEDAEIPITKIGSAHCLDLNGFKKLQEVEKRARRYLPAIKQ